MESQRSMADIDSEDFIGFASETEDEWNEQPLEESESGSHSAEHTPTEKTKRGRYAAHDTRDAKQRCSLPARFPGKPKKMLRYSANADISDEDQDTPGKRRLKEIDLDILMEPLNNGWKREVVLRGEDEVTCRKDIFYYNPKGERFRHMRQITDYLARKKQCGFTKKHFSFSQNIIITDRSDPQKEIVRYTKTLMMERERLAKLGKKTSTKSADSTPAPPEVSKTPEIPSSEKPVRKRGRQRISEIDEIDSQDLNISKSNHQNKEKTETRGRPRKVRIEEADSQVSSTSKPDSQNIQEVTPHATKGRPRKIRVSEPNSQSKTAQQVTPHVGRGRPKKIRTEETNSQDVMNTSKSDRQDTRKITPEVARGRPKKRRIEEVDTQNDEVTGKVDSQDTKRIASESTAGQLQKSRISESENQDSSTSKPGYQDTQQSAAAATVADSTVVSDAIKSAEKSEPITLDKDGPESEFKESDSASTENKPEADKGQDASMKMMGTEDIIDQDKTPSKKVCEKKIDQEMTLKKDIEEKIDQDKVLSKKFNEEKGVVPRKVALKDIIDQDKIPLKKRKIELPDESTTVNEKQVKKPVTSNGKVDTPAKKKRQSKKRAQTPPPVENGDDEEFQIGTLPPGWSPSKLDSEGVKQQEKGKKQNEKSQSSKSIKSAKPKSQDTPKGAKLSSKVDDAKLPKSTDTKPQDVKSPNAVESKLQDERVPKTVDVNHKPSIPIKKKGNEKRRERDTCSISCRLALGSIPTLQCTKCVCLYHFRCANINPEDETSVRSFVCGNCRNQSLIVSPVSSNFMITLPSVPKESVEKLKSSEPKAALSMSEVKSKPEIDAQKVETDISEVRVHKESTEKETIESGETESRKGVTDDKSADVLIKEEPKGVATEEIKKIEKEETANQAEKVKDEPKVDEHIEPKQDRKDEQCGTDLEGVRSQKIVDGVTTWLQPSSSIQLTRSQNHSASLASDRCQDLVKVAGKKYVLVRKQSILNVVTNNQPHETDGNVIYVSVLPTTGANAVQQEVESRGSAPSHLPNKRRNSSRKRSQNRQVPDTDFSGFQKNTAVDIDEEKKAKTKFDTVAVEKFLSEATSREDLSFTDEEAKKIRSSLVEILSYLTVEDLLRVARVNRYLNSLASDPSLWEVVKLKNSRVHNWEACGAALMKHGTKVMNMKKTLLPKSGDDVGKMWSSFIRAVANLNDLEQIDLCRCNTMVVDSVAAVCTNLKVLNALYIGSGNLSFESISTLSELEEIRLKAVAHMDLDGPVLFDDCSHNLKVLSLLNVEHLKPESLGCLRDLVSLESLALGECNAILSDSSILSSFSQLKNLKKLRLETITDVHPEYVFLRVISKLPKLDSLELINIEVRSGFDNAIRMCSNIKDLLLAPKFQNHAATTNRLALNALKEMKNTLKYLTYVVTYELFQITNSFLEKSPLENGSVEIHVDPPSSPESENPAEKKLKESIPVLKVTEETVENYLQKENKGVVETRIDIVNAKRFKSLMENILPNTEINLLKMPLSLAIQQYLPSRK